MKKILSVLLVAVMLLGLCACGSASGGNAAAETTAAPAQSFKAGYSMVDITPSKMGIEMGGYGNQADRLSSGLRSYVYSIAVAMQDAEGNIAVVVSVDQCSISTAVCSDLRSWAQDNLGIPKENILISSIHQHSTPDATDGNYTNEMKEGIKKSIKEAVEDLQSAEIYINKVTTEGMSFVRRFWANDGDFVSSHSGSAASGIRDYESEADKEMRLIKFVREGADPIILVNFQGHPHMGTSSSETDIHSDWPGVMRDEVAKQLGAKCIYFSGAGGNMNSTTRIDEDLITKDKKDFKTHGMRAAEYVVKAESSYTKLEPGLIACVEEDQTYSTDHTLDHLLDAATAVNNVRKTEGMAAAHVAVKEYPELNSAYQASAVVSKAASGDTKGLSYTVITVGDIAFTAHPYEMFDTNGMELREGTVGNDHYAAEDQLENPYEMHFVTSLSNGSEGYIPSYDGFTNGGYERDTTKYAQGTGELIVGDVLHVLNDLHK